MTPPVSPGCGAHTPLLPPNTWQPRAPGACGLLTPGRASPPPVTSRGTGAIGLRTPNSRGPENSARFLPPSFRKGAYASQYEPTQPPAPIHPRPTIKDTGSESQADALTHPQKKIMSRAPLGYPGNAEPSASWFHVTSGPGPRTAHASSFTPPLLPIASHSRLSLLASHP